MMNRLLRYDSNITKNQSTKAETYQCSNIRFADVTKIFRRISTKKDEETLQEDINEMLKWADKWQQVTNYWNSLPDNVVQAPNTKIFESGLDQYWKEYEGKYNFRSTYSPTVD